MEIIGYIVIGIYSLALGYITLFCLLQLNLLYYYKKYHRQLPDKFMGWASVQDDVPMVTV